MLQENQRVTGALVLYANPVVSGFGCHKEFVFSKFSKTDHGWGRDLSLTDHAVALRKNKSVSRRIFNDDGFFSEGL